MNEKNLSYSIDDLDSLIEDISEDRITTGEALISLERNNNILRPTVFPDNFPEKYRPYGHNPPILLPFINLYGNNSKTYISEKFPRKHLENKFINLYLHPWWMRELGKNPDGFSMSVPSSSTRTFYLIDEPDIIYGIKTHLPIHIGPFRRGLSENAIKHGIFITDDLIISMEQECCPSEFGIMAEVLGLVIHDKNESYGCLYRRIDPYPPNNLKKCIILPMFSLYSPAPNNSKKGFLLLQILKKNKNKNENILNTFIRVIIEPYIRNWFWIIENRGLLLELHGQNTLIELDQFGKVNRFIYRDFQGIRVNPKIRESKSHPMFFDRHLLEKESSFRDSLCLIYDTYICDYLFSHFVVVIAKNSNYSIETVAFEIRKVFNKYSGTFSKLFYSQKLRLVVDGNRQRRFEGGDIIFEKHGTPRFR